MVSVVIGWDIGGAHLKAARVETRARRSRGSGGDAALAGTRQPGSRVRRALHSARPRRPSRDHHDRRAVRRLSLAPRGRRGSGCDRGQSSRPCRPEPLCRPGRVRRAWRSRFARRRHRLGQLARERRAPRAQASGRAVHRHRLDDSRSHSDRRRPSRGGRLQRRGTACLGRTRLYRNDPQFRHVIGLSGAVSRRLDSADERIFRQQR